MNTNKFFIIRLNREVYIIFNVHILPRCFSIELSDYAH